MTTRKKAEEDNQNDPEVVEDQAEPFVPNPLYQTGNVATNGEGPRTEDVAPIFARARADALGEAVDALNDADEGDVPENIVLPEQEDKTNEEAVADLKDSAAAASDDADEAEGDRQDLIDGTEDKTNK